MFISWIDPIVWFALVKGLKLVMPAYGTGRLGKASGAHSQRPVL